MIQILLQSENQKTIESFYVNSFSDRVYDSYIFEDKTRTSLNLKKDISYKHYSPDILDINNQIIGEIKTFKENTPKFFLSYNQFLKYLKLKDILNNQKRLDEIKNTFNLFYFFSEHNDNELLNIYTLNEFSLKLLFLSNKIKRTSWYYGQSFIEFNLKELIQYANNP